MHHIHTTCGFIISSRPYGEADRMLQIFTEDLGLVNAVAQGIRFEKSKLRYHVQDYSFGTYSFVRGKDMWRLTSADSAERRDVAGEQDFRKTLIAKIANLLKNVLHGEEPHKDLFQVLSHMFEFLEINNKNFTLEEQNTLEAIIVLRTMHHLGYIASDSTISEMVSDKPISIELVARSMPELKNIITHINRAFYESGIS